MGSARRAMVVALWLLGVFQFPLEAQQRDLDAQAVEAYYGAVGRAFSVSADEVEILGDWPLRTDEIAVALFVAGRAGVSPDAVASLRASGSRWTDVARTYGVSPGLFRIFFPPGAELGPLEEAYRSFAETPRASLMALDISDEAVIALVNIRFLAGLLEVTTSHVLGSWGEEGDFVRVHQQLVR